MTGQGKAGPVIITRAAPGNHETAARLAAAHIPYIEAPMLTLRPTGADLPALGGVQGVLFTSANGVRAFCDVSARRDLTAWCVGPATLTAAQLAGFDACEHGDGNADDLAALIIAKADRQAGRLVHVANAAAAGQLAARLRGAGFGVDFAPLYEAVPAEVLPEAAGAALLQAAPCVILVHSAKGAAAFAGLVDELDLARHIGVAVSDAAAVPLASSGLAHMACAARPNETALLEVLFRTYSTL